MLHLVSTHDDGMERWRGMTQLCVLAMMVELWTRKREMRDAYENDRVDTSKPEISIVRRAGFCWENLVLVLFPAGSGLVCAISWIANRRAQKIFLCPGFS